ncbi:MAG: hypothetical protein AAB520_03100 [Patescibacteria group bacterium]
MAGKSSARTSAGADLQNLLRHGGVSGNLLQRALKLSVDAEDEATSNATADMLSVVLSAANVARMIIVTDPENGSRNLRELLTAINAFKPRRTAVPTVHRPAGEESEYAMSTHRAARG